MPSHLYDLETRSASILREACSRVAPSGMLWPIGRERSELARSIVNLLVPHPLGQRLVAAFGNPATASPIIIGATGGSGTRAVRKLLESAGIYMGTNVNGAGDAMDFEPILDELINQVVSITRTLDYPLDALPKSLIKEGIGKYRATVPAYLEARPPHCIQWGWKNPRSMYLLPFIAAIFPRLRFIHLIRDGRDMALSQNQNQTVKHFSAMFGEELPGGDMQLASCRLWTRANLSTAQWAKRVLGKQYIPVKFEDICNDPQTSAQSLFSRLGIQASDVGFHADVIAKPESLGRWRSLPETDIRNLTAAARDALQEFGYT